MSSSASLPRWRFVWRAAAAIERRSSQAVMVAPGVWLVLTVGLVLAAVLSHNSLRFLQRNAVFTSAEPLITPLFVAMTLTSIYLALQTSLSVSRERDLGTLEVLFYGPVNATAFLVGKFLAGLRVYGAALLVAFVWANLLAWLLNLAFSTAVVVLLLTSIVSAAAMLAFGLLVATLGGRARNTLILFVVVVLALVALQAADFVVSGVPVPENATRNDPLLVLRSALNTVTLTVSWVSPYAQLQNAVTAVVDGVYGRYALHFGVMVLQTVVMLWGSVALLAWRGTRG